MGATLQKIVCKTVGIAGMSAVLYDAYSVAKLNSSRKSDVENADYFEKVYSDTRSTDTESPLQASMQKKVADIRMKNTLVPILSRIKGFISGGLNSLADNIIPVTFASLALAGKGIAAKIGAWGVGLYGAFIVLKEGFGLGKNNPNP